MAKISGWSKKSKNKWQSNNTKLKVSIKTLRKSRGSKPGKYRVDIEDPTTTTRLGPFNSKQKARDKAINFMRKQSKRKSQLPDIKWAKSTNEKNIEWVSTNKVSPNQLEDWYTRKELTEKGWIQERAAKPFYPIPVTPSGNTFVVNDGHHRVSYAIVKRKNQVMVEKPTVFKVKVSGKDRKQTRYGWKYIPKEHPKIGNMNIEKRQEHLKEDFEQGILDWVKKDGKLIFGSQ